MVVNHGEASIEDVEAVEENIEEEIEQVEQTDKDIDQQINDDKVSQAASEASYASITNQEIEDKNELPSAVISEKEEDLECLESGVCEQE